MNNPPYILTEEIGAVVAAVKATLQLPVLNYQYGYLSELQATLGEYSQTLQYSAQKYPLVWLVQPFTIDRVDGSYFGDTRLRLFIIQSSEAAIKASQRMDEVFKPVLYPIYLEILNEIGRRGEVFDGTMYDHIPHSVTDRYYWGEEQAQVLNDVFDCMELGGIQLKISNKQNCTIN